MPTKFLWKYFHNVDSIKANGLRGEGTDAKNLKTVLPEIKDRCFERMQNSSVKDRFCPCSCSSHFGQSSNHKAASVLTFGIPQPVASPYKRIITETGAPVVTSRNCHLLKSGPAEKMDGSANCTVPHGILDDKKEAEKIKNVNSLEFFKYLPVFDHEGDPRFRKYTQSFHNLQLDNDIPLRPVADDNLVCNERNSIFDSLTQGIKRKLTEEEAFFVQGDGPEVGREQSTAQGKSCPPSFYDSSKKSQLTPPNKKRSESGELTYTDRSPGESRRPTSKAREVKGPSPPEVASVKDGRSSSDEPITRTIGPLFVPPTPVENRVNTKNKCGFADSFFNENVCEPVLNDLNYEKTFQPPPLAYSEIFRKGVSREKPDQVNDSRQRSLISNIFRFCYQGGSSYPSPSPLFTGMTGAAQVGVGKKAPTLLYSGSTPDVIYYKRSLSPQKNKVLQETGQAPTRTFNTMSRLQAPNPEEGSEEPKPEPLSDKPLIKPKKVYKDGFRETLVKKQNKLSKAYESLIARNRLRAGRKVSLALNDKQTSKTKLNKSSISANEMRSFDAEKTTGKKRRGMSILDKLNKSHSNSKESPNPELGSSGKASSLGSSGKLNLKAELQKKVLQLTRGKGRENWRADLLDAFFTEARKPQAGWNPMQEVRKKPLGTQLRGRPVESVSQEVGVSYRAIRKKSGTTTPYTVRKSRMPRPPVPADLFKFAGPSTKVVPNRAKGKITAKSYQRVFPPAETKMSKIKKLLAKRAAMEAKREARVKQKPFDVNITHKDIQLGPESPKPPLGLVKSKIEEEFSSRYMERPAKVENKHLAPPPIKVTADSKPTLKPKPPKRVIERIPKTAHPALGKKPGMQAPGQRQKLSNSKDLQPQVYAKTSLLLKTSHLPLEPCERVISRGSTPGGSFTSKLDPVVKKKAQEGEPSSRKCCAAFKSNISRNAPHKRHK